MTHLIQWQRQSVFLIALSITGLFSPSLQAALFSFGLEPIIGYERVQKLLPIQHNTTRVIYGASLTLGIPLLSLEAIYTRGQDTESYPSDPLTIKDTDDKLKVGSRSVFRLGPIFSLRARVGAQAKRNTHEETRSGVTTKVIGKIVYKPYAGLGVSSRLGRNFDLTGGVNLVFNDFPRMSQNEYETTLGFNIRLP